MTSTSRWIGWTAACLGPLLSALLLAVYARSDAWWGLGFVVLLPWILGLERLRSWRSAWLSGWAMCVAFTLAVFGWFGSAIGSYTGWGTLPALALLAVLAPLLQPQVWVYALARHWAARRHGWLLRALAASAAWIACEWLWPKLLGDTLGHGLAPADAMRQIADLGGAAGLTLLLILVNEALAAAWTQRRSPRTCWAALLLAAAVPALMAGYGSWRLQTLRAAAPESVPALRIGMIQASIVDYEAQRAVRGSYAVVREVLDTHFALSRAAIEHHGVDALLWSETVYPTTYGRPRSEDGASLDQEIREFAATQGVSLVFGTYDIDDAGEYNAAAFLTPQEGLLGYYRKSHPFPLTEHVPAWLDGPRLRSLLPWTGHWQPGSGARVYPLRAADGRELQVVPLICLDDVHTQLAIDGARLGAQAIIGLSNDAWFSGSPLGARLHLNVAAFRSIETRLPQLRVTTNGLSAFIDPGGEVLASTQMGDRAVLAGELPIQDVAPTLMVRWGNWLGGAALGFWGLLVLSGWLRAWSARRTADLAAPAVSVLSARVLPTAWRVVAASLHVLAAVGLLALFLPMWRDGFQVNSLQQLKLYAGMVVLPLLLAGLVGRTHRARVQIAGNALVFELGTQRIEVPLSEIRHLRLWRLPLPGYGVQIEFASGRRWSRGIQLTDPSSLLRLLQGAGVDASYRDAHDARIAEYAHVRTLARWRWLDHPLTKFLGFPLLAALPAFRLHQHIAFGGTFGEWYTFGAQAWWTGLAIWWAAWSIGLMLLAAGLRLQVELLCLSTQRLAPERLASARILLEGLSRVCYYLGVPIWLAVRILVAD
ncbi:MAG: apolipoprotein N-acyltransferase [Lysobacterales bacterium]